MREKVEVFNLLVYGIIRIGLVHECVVWLRALWVGNFVVVFGDCIKNCTVVCAQVQSSDSKFAALFLVLFVDEDLEVLDGALLCDFLHDVGPGQVVRGLLLHRRVGILGDGGELLHGFFLDFDAEIVTIFVLWRV